MEKNIEYYLGLPYTRELIREASGIWFVRIKELPNCMSQGDTPEEALRNIDDAMLGWIKGELEDGEPIPEPRDEEEYSGKFNTRVPKSLHRKLVEIADREGVSLNQWINTALAEAVGSSVAKSSEKNIKAEKRASDLTWPGLTDAIQCVLDDVGMHREAGVIDEQLFAGWLEQNLEEIAVECQQSDYEQALSNARALSALLKEHKNRSPILHIIHKTIADQVGLLEQTCHMKQIVLEAEHMHAQISNILGSINAPILGRIRESENERHSISTSRRPIELIAQESEPAGW